MAGDEVIRARGLTKRYGRRSAVLDLDLDVGRGEVSGFLGPNGAGKTTTIRMLLDLVRPTAGELTVLGRSPRATAPSRRMGYVPGDVVLPGQGTGAALLHDLARLRGGVAAGRISALADRLDLDLSRPVRELSRGNRQKLALAQAFAPEPELLVLDEPTAGLDPLLRQTFVELVTEVRDAGRTVFLSSHVLSEVQATAGRVAMIRGGRLVAVDGVDALRERAVRRVDIWFDDVVDAAQFAMLPGVGDVVVEPHPVGGTVLRCRLTGRADPVVKAAASHPVRTLQVEEPDLEQVFLTLYQEPDA